MTRRRVKKIKTRETTITVISRSGEHDQTEIVSHPNANLRMRTEPAIPRSVVQMVPVDLEGRLLVMHRSDKVRSAKNVWSFPSGLHDIGETQEQSVARELLEEYDLKLRRAAICAV